MATAIEPIVAAVVGFVFFHQVLEPVQIVGAFITIAAALPLTLQQAPGVEQGAVVATES